jgi:hypothetical protein
VELPSTAVVVDDEEYEEDEKLTLKERRRRRSPLSLPNTDQLTLALKEMMVEEQLQDITCNDAMQQQQPTRHPFAASNNKRQTYDATIPQVYNLHGIDSTSSLWRQQLLEQTLAFSFEDQSRRDAMLTLEGKRARAVALRPIAPVEELDHHFDKTKSRDVVKDKAQYDAIVSRTRRQSSTQQQLHDESGKRQSLQRASSLLRARSSSAASEYQYEDSSHNSSSNIIMKQSTVQQQQPLEIICENQVATPKIKHIPHFTVTPETPPYHKQTAPSLISAPSTPNSIDSSVIEHDDYMGDERLQQHLTLSN